jgi:glycosyltransferase involved in cell wall biosynthesis
MKAGNSTIVNKGGKQMADKTFPGRLALQQRVLPAYRLPFIDALAQACAGGLSVFAGQPQPGEQITAAQRPEHAVLVPARNRHFLDPSSPFYQCWQPGLLAWLEDWQPDALVVEANPRYRNTPAAVRWMHARGRPVIGWGLGAPPVSGPLAAWRAGARTKFLTSLDALIAYSQRGAREYRLLGFPADRVFVAPNAVAPAPTQPPPARPDHFNVRPHLLFVGRLQERKRIDHLLRACQALPEALQPEVRIVGDGPARPELERLAGQLYPAARFSGAHFGAELDADFAWADLFVLPGTGGLAVQQAMSHGLPVIVAQGDGTQDDLVRSANGWQVAGGDLASLQSALAAALSDAPRLRQMGLESYHIVHDEINLETMVNVFIHALRKVR